MMNRLQIVGLTLALLGGGAAVSPENPSNTSHQDPGAPAANPSAKPEGRGSLLLTIKVDAKGVHVLHATAKPDLKPRTPKNSDRLKFRWRIRDGQGRVVATAGFEPSRLCLDASHVGQPPHLEGDFLLPHVGYTNIKVPDLGRGFVTIEFGVHDAGRERPFGTARRDQIRVR